MIVDVPVPSDYHTAGVNQLYLGWQIAMQTLNEYDQAMDYGGDDAVDAQTEYWKRAQPALANAYSLIQQGMELALKGRIATVSPLLLIGDPGDWTGRAATEDVSFGEFRTLDAADLVKVHNCVIAPALDDRFKAFWDEVRRERNKIMHSASPKTLAPVDVVRAILVAAETLFGDERWPPRLLEMENDGGLAVLGFNDNVTNQVMSQVETAMEHLTPAEAKRFFGFDKGRRAYLCPACHSAANKDWQEEWPHLAQFPSRARGATRLACIVCEVETEVERRPCEDPDCKGDVISDDRCLTCTRSQEHIFEIDSGLTDDSLSSEGHTYRFIFGQGTAGAGGYFASDQQRLADDNRAREHAAFALRQPHLARWNTVTILLDQPRAFPDLTVTDRVLGYWRRGSPDLEWVAEARADQPVPGLTLL